MRWLLNRDSLHFLKASVHLTLNQNKSIYYCWSKAFLEAGKQRLVGNTKREASSEDVQELRQENEQLKQLVAELALKNRVLGQTKYSLA